MAICEIRIKTRFPVKFEGITKFSTLITFEVLKKIKKMNHKFSFELFQKSANRLQKIYIRFSIYDGKNSPSLPKKPYHWLYD